MSTRRRVKAGHRRALARLARSVLHWRCPACLDDARPVATVDGLRCPFCGTVDVRSRVVIRPVPSRSGFWWKATLEPAEESCAIG